MQITRDISRGVQMSRGYLLRVIHFGTDPVNARSKINPGCRPADETDQYFVSRRQKERRPMVFLRPIERHCSSD